MFLVTEPIIVVLSLNNVFAFILHEPCRVHHVRS